MAIVICGQLMKYNPKPKPEKSPYLESLNKKVIDGRMKDRIYGRNSQLERLQSTLMRRQKCNAILVGEAGTGKTSIVEELAFQIVERKVPDDLLDCEVYELDLNGLIAGTQNRGEYETRIKSVLESLENAAYDEPKKVVFIDEIHNIVGTDGTESGTSISNMLKPALARGTFKCIGATTTDEYVKYILPDGALSRRFQSISVDALDLNDTFEAVMTIKEHFEKHHRCIYTISAIKACIYIADKYIKYRQNPDKTIDLIDELGSHFAMHKKTEKVHQGKLIDKKYVYEFCEAFLGVKIESFKKEVKHMGKSVQRIVHLKTVLNEKVHGQGEAISRICQSLMRKECCFNDAKRPIASFMLTGPSSTGKTELARTLGDVHFGKTMKLDMSEYMEKVSAATLIGTPPGYVGFDEGGVLTNFVKRNPYSLIIFDEIEKAHPTIITLLLQILEDGILTDNDGLTISFSNTMIIMTTNVLSQNGHSMGFEPDTKESQSTHSMSDYFKPEFINRIDDIIHLNQLDDENLRFIARRKIQEKMDQIQFKYPDLYDGGLYSTSKISQWVDEIMKFESSTNAREISRNAENFVVDLHVPLILKNLS